MKQTDIPKAVLVLCCLSLWLAGIISIPLHAQTPAKPPSPEKITGALRAAETFFTETLSPFEATHRGFRGANLELRQVNQALQRRNAELAGLSRDLRNLSSQVLHLQEEERKRISRELHDEVGQALTVLNTNLGM